MYGVKKTYDILKFDNEKIFKKVMIYVNNACGHHKKAWGQSAWSVASSRPARAS